MARKVKFPLDLKDGYQARSNIEEVRTHFDLEKIIAQFHNGKLKIWLEDHYLPAEAEQVGALNGNAPDLAQRLCTILGVTDVPTENVDTKTVQTIQRREERRHRLSQYTTNPILCDRAEFAAFEQSDLDRLIKEGVQEIILCNASFRIPLNVKNKTYLGVGKAVAVIDSKTAVDFETLGIRFVDVSFDEKYTRLFQETKKKTEETVKRKQITAVVLAELCSVFMEGKLKNGTILWPNRNPSSIYWENGGYTYRVHRDFSIENTLLDGKIRRSETIIGYGKPNNSQNILLFTYRGIYLFVSKRLTFIRYKDIDTIDLAVKEAAVLQIRTVSGDTKTLEIPSVWKAYIPLDMLRLFLLTAAYLLGESTYKFTKKEMDILNGIMLESLENKNIAEFL